MPQVESPKRAQNSNWTRGTIATGVLALLVALLGVGACGGNDLGGPPGYYGAGAGIGGACRGPYDCSSAFCCTSPPCGGGMCSFACRGDFDCPGGSRCDSGACFWACSNDAQCAWGQTCKKTHTLCQY